MSCARETGDEENPGQSERFQAFRRMEIGERPGLSPVFPKSLSRNSFRSSGFVRRAHVGEFREQVFVGRNLVSLHLSVGEDRQEEVHDIVGERPAIVGEGRRPR